MRTPIALTSLTVALLASAALLPSVAYAETIVVPTDHETINAAFANATHNDTIIVKKGTYAEAVLLQGLNGIKVLAKGKVVIRPPDDDEDGFTVRDCTSVTIQGFAVEQVNDGFVIDDCEIITLSKFSVKSALRHGVHAFGSNDVDVIQGKIVGCGRDGVSFADELPLAPVTRGTIQKVKIALCDEDGIDILGTNITVTRCTVKKVNDDGFESDDNGAGPVTFDRCRAIDTGDEGFELGCPATTCTKCTSKKSDDDGFDIEADDCVLEKCTAVGASNAGFSIDGIDNAQLTKCKSVKSKRQGYEFFDATDAMLDGCKSIKAGTDGFEFDGGTSGCVLTKCKGLKSKDFDLDDRSGGANEFIDSKFKKVNESDASGAGETM